MTIPRNVKRCTTHYYACECNHWRYKQMERALEVISVWADSHRNEDETETLRDIAKTANNALNCLGNGENSGQL